MTRSPSTRKTASINSNHDRAERNPLKNQLATANCRSSPLGSSTSTSRVETLFPRSIRTITLSGSSATCRDTRPGFLPAAASTDRAAVREAPLMREQDLQPFARDRRRGRGCVKKLNRFMRPSVRTACRTGPCGRSARPSRRSRPAAAWPRPYRRGRARSSGCSSVTGEPILEARSTSWLSGMMPSSGIERISSTSSMLEHLAARGARRVVAGDQQVLVHPLALLGLHASWNRAGR